MTGGKLTGTIALVACVWCAAASAQTDLPREVLALSRIKSKMRANLAKLPDYTCVETILRSERATGASIFRLKDSLRVDVLHVGNKELYAWPGSKKFDENLSRMIGAGTTSSGEFALHARSIFLGDAQYTYKGEVTLRGRAALRYDYTIPLLSSGMTLGYGTTIDRVSMQGSFWADAETLDLLRLDVHVGDIPQELPYVSGVSTVDYGRVRIGETEVLLPQSAEVELRMKSDSSDRNEIHFSQCRGFEAQSELHFDVGASSETPPAETTPKFEEFELPPGVQLSLGLTRAIDSATAKEGDAIEARVEQDVRRKRDVVIPAGAVARGRIRRLETYDQPRRFFIVGLEFTEIEFDRKRAVFTGSLDRVDPSPKITWFLGASKNRTIADMAGVTDSTTNERIHTADLPGVGTFFVDGEHFQLPAGFHMMWRTVEQKKR